MQCVDRTLYEYIGILYRQLDDRPFHLEVRKYRGKPTCNYLQVNTRTYINGTIGYSLLKSAHAGFFILFKGDQDEIHSLHSTESYFTPLAKNL